MQQAVNIVRYGQRAQFCFQLAQLFQNSSGRVVLRQHGSNLPQHRRVIRPAVDGLIGSAQHMHSPKRCSHGKEQLARWNAILHRSARHAFKSGRTPFPPRRIQQPRIADRFHGGISLRPQITNVFDFPLNQRKLLFLHRRKAQKTQPALMPVRINRVGRYAEPAQAFFQCFLIMRITGQRELCQFEVFNQIP